jgi:drug/metabolite transporter (DMT)-like permease
LISAVGPTQTAMTAYLIPLFGVVWGVLLLGETVGPATVVGMAVILAGVLLVTGAGPSLSRRDPLARPQTAE